MNVGIWVFTGCCLLAACNRSDAAPSGGAPSASPAQQAPATAPSQTCPIGRWEYDYADQFLESLTRNMPGAEVVREKGKFICTISGTERGSYVCEVTEGGVENVFEARTAAGLMQITMTIRGRSKVDFEPAGPNRWRTTQSDMRGLDMQTTATLGGRSLPMPAAQSLIPGFDRAGTILEYQCAGETLRLKPQIEGVTTDWANLKRVR
jgi:hypothetical protein